MNALQIAVAYTAFAALATAANLLTQALALLIYHGPAALLLSIAAGTGIGLILKYVLDKRYIFHFFPRNAAHDGQTFVLYTVTGIVTTAIFWGAELSAYHVFGTQQAKYLGAVAGLAIGYVVKYRLDKRHVFHTEQTA